MNPFRLPSGIKCQVLDRAFRLGNVELSVADVMELARVSFANWPLIDGDERLKLMDEIREALVKEETSTGLRWIVLNALRNVSLRKWRSRHHRANAA